MWQQQERVSQSVTRMTATEVQGAKSGISFSETGLLCHPFSRVQSASSHDVLAVGQPRNHAEGAARRWTQGNIAKPLGCSTVTYFRLDLVSPRPLHTRQSERRPAGNVASLSLMPSICLRMLMAIAR